MAHPRRSKSAMKSERQSDDNRERDALKDDGGGEMIDACLAHSAPISRQESNVTHDASSRPGRAPRARLEHEL